ncbi:MAG: hypothetical protein ACI4J5_01730 [Oscillospiraceae bacterium]
MQYSYKLTIPPAHEAVRELTENITTLYPGFSKTESKDYGDNAVLTKFSDGKAMIVAETDFKEQTCIISSDIPLKELIKLYVQEEKAVRSVDRADRMNKKWFFSVLDLLKSLKAVKYIWVPAGIVIIYITANIITSGSFYIDIGIYLAGALLIAFLLGWIWLLPAIPVTMLTSYSKSGFVSKAVTMSLPLMSAAYLTANFLIPELTKVSLSDIYGLMMYGFYFPVFIIGSAPLIYLAALPYMIIDDLCISFRKELHGKKPSGLHTFYGWLYAVLGSIAVVIIGTSVIDSREPITPNVDLNIMYNEALTDKYAVLYGNDMLDIAEYALSHNVTDWEECPDESLESSCQHVFSGDIVSGLIIDKDEQTVRFSCGKDGDFLVNTDTDELYKDSFHYYSVPCVGVAYDA